MRLLALNVLSLLIICKTHKILIVSSYKGNHPLSLFNLASSLDTHELHFATTFINHDIVTGHPIRRFHLLTSDVRMSQVCETFDNCDSAIFEGYQLYSDVNHITKDVGYLPQFHRVSIQLEKHYIAVDNILSKENFDVIITEKEFIYLRVLADMYETPFMIYTDEVILGHTKIEVLVPPSLTKVAENATSLPSTFTQRFNSIKQMMKYIISVCKKDGMVRCSTLVRILVSRGRIDDAVEHRESQLSYVEMYNVDVWCLIFFLIAVLAGTVVYLTALIVLHIVEKSRGRNLND